MCNGCCVCGIYIRKTTQVIKYGKNKTSNRTKDSVRMSKHKLFGGFIDTICSFGMNPLD